MIEYITSVTMPKLQSDIHSKTMNILISLSMDVRTKYLREIANWETESSLVSFVPSWVKSGLVKWKSVLFLLLGIHIPAESYIFITMNYHVNSWSEHSLFSINLLLKNLLYCLISFMMEYITSATTDIQNHNLTYILKLWTFLFHCQWVLNYLQEMTTNILTKLLGQNNDNEARLLREHLLEAGNTLLDMCLNLSHLSC